MEFVRRFKDVGADDVALVGGKNASLGEMIQNLERAGVPVPDGFAVTSVAYRSFLAAAPGLLDHIRDDLVSLDKRDVTQLIQRSRSIRRKILEAELPPEVCREIVEAYHSLGQDLYVAVRSSATAEDLPNASFAGQQESYLYVHGEAELLGAVQRCYASLFTARAISYRIDMGFDHLDVALSVGIQRMVHADCASSGVMFTLDPDTGFKDVILVTSAYGLGESVVQGTVEPDQFFVHKPTLERGFRPIVRRTVGSKEVTLVFDQESHRGRTIVTGDDARRRLSLDDDEVLRLARWGLAIEAHYSKRNGRWTPMDIEWAKDSRTGLLFIVQARPETVHARRPAVLRSYAIREAGSPVVEGSAVGDAAATGRARVIRSVEQMAEFQDHEVLIAEKTDPDWEPILERASAIVTEHGGRTSHAAIVARELGIPAVVGAPEATQHIGTGTEITVSCCEGATGRVYEGKKSIDIEEVVLADIPNPKRTKVMMNLANPDLAFKHAQLPNDGVGLARMEFILASWVGVHPRALLHPEQVQKDVRLKIEERTGQAEAGPDFFVNRLAEGIGTIAAAFWPKPVILRFSDFKTNEYRNLLGGEAFEPQEENPMLGWRGASRYYHPEYVDAFLLEVRAVERVRSAFGLTNLAVMIPFCRTPDEAKQVLEVMKRGGLERGQGDLNVYVMAEIPSNILLADQFAELFDGFSIGSNDLTQLILGVDRDSERIAALFDERNDAVLRACEMLVRTAHANGRTVGICGQAPSDHPEFAEFLVGLQIDSLSLTPDAMLSVRARVAAIDG